MKTPGPSPSRCWFIFGLILLCHNVKIGGMTKKNWAGWAIIAVVIILGLVRVLHLVQNSMAEEPWLRIIYFLVSAVGLLLCVSNLVKVLRTKFAVGQHLVPFLVLFVGSILSLWIFMDEIVFFVFRVL